MPARQRYRLRARSDREIISEVEPGKTYVDRDSGEEFEVVAAMLPLAPSPATCPTRSRTCASAAAPSSSSYSAT